MLLPAWFFNLSEQTQLKLKNDIFYLSMIENGFSYDELLNSGWISTNYSIDDNIYNQNIFSTNIHQKIIDSPNPDFCILLNTGSYAPAHYGHIEMMLQAKNIVEKEGYKIDSILFSPSHDNYVLKKSKNISYWNIQKRIEELLVKINTYPNYKPLEKELLSIDLWESLWCNSPVNFTDVILKIEKNFVKFFNKKLKIFYVFGSDNESFSNCFSFLQNQEKNKYFGVCIERFGFPILNKKDNIFYSSNHCFSKLQSRKIRTEETNTKSLSFNKYNFIYGVRLDSDLALKLWIEKYPEKKEQLTKDYLVFHDKLKENIYLNTNIQTISIDSKEQSLYLNEINTKSINIDKCTYNNSIYSLDVSRIFRTNDFQNVPLEIIIKKNETIPPDSYIIIDDDIASGATIKFIKENLLKEGILINNEISLLDLYLKNKNIIKQTYDIIDTRDFLTGSNEGGLYCKFQDNLRLPYFTPWVNLFSRAKIPFENQKKFMILLLESLEVFFEKNSYLSFSDFNPGLKDFLQKNHNTESITLWHKYHKKWVIKN